MPYTPETTASHSTHVFAHRSSGLRWVALCICAALLQACGWAKPSWIEAPLVADAYSSDSGYFPRDGQLMVNQRASSQLNFSYATLPEGPLIKLTANTTTNTITQTQSNYQLSAAKVFSARLVLYVDEVIRPGYLQIVSAHKVGADCFVREDDAPQGCDQLVSSTSGPVSAQDAATDADAPTQPLRVTERGFYSFDVTRLVKYRLANKVDSMIVVSAAPDPAASPTDSGSLYGSFVFASKDQHPNDPHAMHQPQLLITLVDAAGSTYRSRLATSVRQSSTNPAVATQDFKNDENLWMNGAVGERAYALIEQPPLETGGATLRTVFNSLGMLKGKQSLVTFVNAPVQDITTISPQVKFYTRRSFTWRSSLVQSWNDGWSEPSDTSLFATAALDRTLPNQQVLVDTSAPYITALATAYRNDSISDFAVTSTTNLQLPVTLDSDDNTRTAHGPRFVTVLVDDVDPDRTIWSNLLGFDKHDSAYSLSYCNHRGTTNCDAVLSGRARLGQPFNSMSQPLIINPWAKKGANAMPFATPINIVVPTSGASALLDSDPNPYDQGLSADLAGTYGYVLSAVRANRVVGRYQAIVSMPGHNLRTTLDLENLPLPVPTLSGPTTLSIEPGSTTVTLAPNAAVPLRLSVADPVGANIDNTTRWIITSSNPADTMPGELQQSEGSTAFAATFSGFGARTLTAKSKGDTTISTTLNIAVIPDSRLPQAITFSSVPPVIPLVGSSYAVTATGGASGNTVTFSIDTASTPGACSILGSVVNILAAGTCTINADQAGNASYAAAARQQQTLTIAASFKTFTGLTVPTTGAGSLASASIHNGGVNCQFDTKVTRFEAGGVTPPGKAAPQGLFRFRLTGCDHNATVTVTTVWPQPVATFIKRNKVGNFITPSNLVVNNSNTVSFDVTDNQPGDDDPTLGTIEDPVMPLAAAGPLGAQPIPTLSEWGLLLLIALMCMLACGGARRLRRL